MDKNMKRHVGKLINLDQKIVVLLMQIPDREDHSLVVLSGSLPDREHDLLMTLLDSDEGQSTQNLYDLIMRRSMPDNASKSFLQHLHEKNYLRAEPVDNIAMYPLPNQPYLLRDILVNSGKLSQSVSSKEEVPAVPEFNRHITNLNADDVSGNIDIAKNLLFEAQLLVQEAASKRERAYRMAPQLRPSVDTTVINNAKLASVDVNSILRNGDSPSVKTNESTKTTSKKETVKKSTTKEAATKAKVTRTKAEKVTAPAPVKSVAPKRVTKSKA